MFLQLKIFCGLLLISGFIKLNNGQEKIIYGCDNDMVKNFSTTVNMLQLANENFRLKLDVIDKKLSGDLMNDFKSKLAQATTNAIKEMEAWKIVQKSEFHKNLSNKAWYEKLLNSSDGRMPFGFCNKVERIPENCAEALTDHSSCTDGIYLLHVPGFELEPFYAYCMRDPQNNEAPAWTVIQRRKDSTISFNKSWEDYKNGFGNLYKNFWLGLSRLHAMTATQHYELWIELEDHDGEKRKAAYESFVIGSEKQKFPLNILGKFSGNVSDAFTYRIGQKFTTFDADNDERIDSNCAVDFSGGWWFENCHVSNLNGEYDNKNYGKGIIWKGWHEYEYSLKYAHMAIRPKSH